MARTQILAVLLFAEAFCLHASAGSAPYTFTKIADSSDVFASFAGGISMNAAGTVAFQATLDTGDQGVFTGNGGAIATIVTTRDSRLNGLWQFGGLPSINNAGIVSFFGFNNLSDSGIFINNKRELNLVVDNSGAFSGFGG